MAFLNTGFTGAFSPLWTALEMKPPDPVVQETLRRYGRQSVKKRHEQLEAMITDTPFLVEDRLTLADTTLIGVARWSDFHAAIDPSSCPKLAALRARIEADPAVRFALAVEEGTALQGGSPALPGHIALSEVV